jgi:Holliday junction resolvase RusA-like endonuclease
MTTPKSITVTLRWPPTDTRYWTRIMRGKHSARVLSDDGMTFRGSVALVFNLCAIPVKFHGLVAVDIELRRNDSLRPDVRGFIDPVIDALTRAVIWRSEAQVESVSIRRGPKVPGESRAIVTITELVAEAS